MEFDLKIYGIVTIAYYGQVCDYDGTSSMFGSANESKRDSNTCNIELILYVVYVYDG